MVNKEEENSVGLFVCEPIVISRSNGWGKTYKKLQPLKRLKPKKEINYKRKKVRFRPKILRRF